MMKIVVNCTKFALNLILRLHKHCALHKNVAVRVVDAMSDEICDLWKFCDFIRDENAFIQIRLDFNLNLVNYLAL